MNKYRQIISCLIIVFGFAECKVHAQINSGVTVTGHITAEVIEAFSAIETAQMNFGSFSPGPQGGKIVLTPESSISVAGSVFAGIGVHNAASFYITGDPNASFTISLPKDPVILTHLSSPRTMVVEGWMSTPIAEQANGILKEGEQTIYVGAILKVGTIQDNPAGVYAGTYAITFDFN